MDPDTDEDALLAQSNFATVRVWGFLSLSLFSFRWFTIERTVLCVWGDGTPYCKEWGKGSLGGCCCCLACTLGLGNANGEWRMAMAMRTSEPFKTSGPQSKRAVIAHFASLRGCNIKEKQGSGKKKKKTRKQENLRRSNSNNNKKI